MTQLGNSPGTKLGQIIGLTLLVSLFSQITDLCPGPLKPLFGISCPMLFQVRGSVQFLLLYLGQEEKSLI